MSSTKEHTNKRGQSKSKEKIGYDNQGNDEMNFLGKKKKNGNKSNENSDDKLKQEKTPTKSSKTVINIKDKKKYKKNVDATKKDKSMMVLEEISDDEKQKQKENVKKVKEVKADDENNNKNKIKRTKNIFSGDSSMSSDSENGKKDIDNSKPKLKEKVENKHPGEPWRILVKGIDASFSQKDLESLFKKCGQIINITYDKSEIISSHEYKCYIDFNNLESMEAALEKNGTKLKGKKILIEKFSEVPQIKCVEKKSVEEQLNDMRMNMNNGFLNLSNLFNSEMASLKKKIETLEDKIEINETQIGIMYEIMSQSDDFYNKKFDSLNNKIKSLSNSFKVLYFRKLSNLLYNRIVEKYKNQLAKTKKIFGPEGKKFGLIVAKNNIEDIEKLKFNLLLDFLRHIKKISSKIIHFRGFEGIQIQKEIFYELIDIKREKDAKNFKRTGVLKIKDIADNIFEEKNEKKEKDISEIEITQFDKIIDQYIEEQEKIEKANKEDDKNVQNQEEKVINEKIDEEDEYKDKKDENKSNESLENKLIKIMSGKSSVSKIKTSNLLRIFKDKALLNKRNNEILSIENKEVNPSFYYLSWKTSFKDIEYKKTKEFQNFVDFERNKISLNDMNNYVKKLLENETFNFFKEDPDDNDNLINEIIDEY